MFDSRIKRVHALYNKKFKVNVEIKCQNSKTAKQEPRRNITTSDGLLCCKLHDS